jgi:hypothetical protein
MSDESPKLVLPNAATAKGTPHWFAKEVLGFNPYGWQEKILWDLAVGDKPVFVKAANGSGKTQGIAAVATLWHAAAFPNSQTVTTAGVYRQVKEQLWGNIRMQRDKLGSGWKLNTTDLEAPNGSKGIGFSTEDPNKFEGWHNDNLLLILDEAKSINDELWQAVQRCNAPRVRILVMSSCGSSEGFFPEAFTTKREFFSLHSVTSYDCPHLSDKWIQDQIDYWGREHPLIRSMIFSEFVDQGAAGWVVPRMNYINCLDNPPDFSPGRKLAFIDWAAGGDENVIALLNGNRVETICWREKNTMNAANRAMIELLKREVPLDRIYADDGGLGHPINDALAAAGFPVRRVLNQTRSNQPDHFAHFGAELWYEAARVIERKGIILPEDRVLMEQVTNRKTVLTNNGKLSLEKKDAMRSRGLSSPDRADAVLAAIAIANTTGSGYSDAVDYTTADTGVLITDENELSGIFAGL